MVTSAFGFGPIKAAPAAPQTANNIACIIRLEVSMECEWAALYVSECQCGTAHIVITEL